LAGSAHAVPGCGAGRYQHEIEGAAWAAIYVCGQECSDAYAAAQGRFADYLVKLKGEGKAAEASDLQQSVAQLESSAGTEQKVRLP